ncbi:hypothetical protein DDZ13_04480 [Coraliomargarita sinensis]|uniref:Uncharacterized protein n=1 Tax=Coraliomargarita sinensis TaxID=2174842 RepID=A0A317ZLW6_9BACT|nr:hypothetical protein DDZ13_04480 [Coraliomargarita sinensis]
MIIAIALAALLFIFHSIENSRGLREWERVKNEIEAKGVRLEWKDYIPNPVPDEENFTATPIIAHFQYDSSSPHHTPWQDDWGDKVSFKGLFQLDSGGVRASESLIHKGERVWHESRFEGSATRRERLKSEGISIIPENIDPWEQLENLIQPHESLLDELRQAAATRPKSYIHGNYHGMPFDAPMPSFASTRNLTHLLYADALCALRNDDVGRALKNAQSIKRLGNTNPGMYFLVNAMIDNVARKEFEIPIYQLALKNRQLSDHQLKKLISKSLQNDALQAFEWSIQHEIAAGTESVLSHYEADWFFLSSSLDESWLDRLSESLWTTILKGIPDGWAYIMASRQAYYMSLTLDQYDPETRKLNLETIAQNQIELDRMIHEADFFDTLAAMAVPALGKVTQSALELHCQQDMLGIACALELYRRENKELPEDLSSLTTRYISQLYPDPATGRHYHYERLDKNHFRLWGAGLDGQDNGGQYDPDLRTSEQADIIWPGPVIFSHAKETALKN